MNDDAESLRIRLAAAMRRLRKLEFLEEYGVDEWDRYDEAMQAYRETHPSDFDDGTE